MHNVYINYDKPLQLKKNVGGIKYEINTDNYIDVFAMTVCCDVSDIPKRLETENSFIRKINPKVIKNILDRKSIPTLRVHLKLLRTLGHKAEEFRKAFMEYCFNKYSETNGSENNIKEEENTMEKKTTSKLNRLTLNISWPENLGSVKEIGTLLCEALRGDDFKNDAMLVNYTHDPHKIDAGVFLGEVKEAVTYGKVMEGLRQVLRTIYNNTEFDAQVLELDEPLYYLVPADDYVELHSAALDSDHKTHIKDLYEENDILSQISNADSWDSIAKAILDYTNSEEEDYSLNYRYIDKDGLDTEISVRTPHYQKLTEAAAEDAAKSAFDGNNNGQQNRQPETVPSAYPVKNSSIPKNTAIDLSAKSFDYNKLNELANTIPGEVKISTNTLMRPNNVNPLICNPSNTIIPHISINTNTIFSSKALKELIDSIDEDTIALNINQTIIKNPKAAPKKIDPCDECSSCNGYDYPCPYGHSYWDECK